MTHVKIKLKTMKNTFISQYPFIYKLVRTTSNVAEYELKKASWELYSNIRNDNVIIPSNHVMFNVSKILIITLWIKKIDHSIIAYNYVNGM